MTTATQTTKADLEQTVEELEKQLAAAQSQLGQVTEELARAKQDARTIDLSEVYVWETPDDVKRAYTRQMLLDMAWEGLRRQNKRRIDRGLPPLQIVNEDAAINAECRRIFDVRERSLGYGQGRRVIKMWVPNERTIRQIPFEDHLNNQGASIADGIERYRMMGYKEISPPFCARQNCFKLAHKDHNGYCDRDHENEVEGAVGKVRVR